MAVIACVPCGLLVLMVALSFYGNAAGATGSEYRSMSIELDELVYRRMMDEDGANNHVERLEEAIRIINDCEAHQDHKDAIISQIRRRIAKDQREAAAAYSEATNRIDELKAMIGKYEREHR